MNLEFSPARWGRLLTYRLMDSAKPLGLALAVVTGLQLAVVLLVRESSFRIEGDLWGLFVGFASVFTAASAFRPMHEGRSAPDWLLWPASHEEKWAAAWAETLLIPLGLVVGAIAGSALVSAAGWALHGLFRPVWLPSTAGVDPAVLAVILAVFVAGSATFRKNALWKTGLTVVATGLAVGLVTLLILKVAGLLPPGGPGHRGLHVSIGDGGWDRSSGGPVAFLANLWFFGVVPLFCLAFSWAKVREKEARDEVQ